LYTGDQSMKASGGQGAPAGVRQGPSAEQLQKINEQKLKGMKSASKGMAMGLNKMVAQYEKLEKSGTPIPQELKDKLAKAQGMIDAIKNATTAEEVEAVDTDEFSTIMEDLGNNIGKLKEQAAMFNGLKKAAKSIQNGINLFEKQLNRIVAQGVAIPQDTADTLARVKNLIQALKDGKTFADVEAAGINDIDELMTKLDSSREQLEILARWPKTLKMINQQLTSLDKINVRLQTKMTNLSKKGIDVSDDYAKFTASLDKLKATRDDAITKMAASQSQEAFDTIENTFYDEMDHAYEYQRVIETMANLGGFTSTFKKAVSGAQKQINLLTKKGVDATEMQSMFNIIKAKGNEILATIKGKEFDNNTMTDNLQALEDAKQSFLDKYDELIGGQPMPWDTGTKTFKPVTIPTQFNQALDRLQAQP
ncbi:MAG: hypothetical protein WCL61_03930, partial [bacterium]